VLIHALKRLAMASAFIIAKKRQQREEFQQAITAQEEGTNLRHDNFGRLAALGCVVCGFCL